MAIGNLFDWFAGGPTRYMTLVHCMNHDMFWIRLTVALDLLVAAGYLLIALHWRRNARTLPASPAKSALGTMKNIFVYCGLCGYLFIPIKMYWPGWRLYDFFLGILAYYTWRYALRSRDLRVIYEELGKSAQLARDLEQSREEGRRKSYFLNAVSHDLKTPLNGLMLQAELAELHVDSDDPDELRKALAEIKGCARATADLLNRFLEIGRLDWADEPTQRSRVELAEVLPQVAQRARAQAEKKGLALGATCPPGLAVETDRLKLERILFNLVDNAIKFTPEGSVSLQAEAGAGVVRVHVVDTGVGIATEHQALIFDDFTQVHNRERDGRKGFGLGLAIARRLAAQVGGQIALESVVGRGSRFVVTLPAAGAASPVGDPVAGRPGPSFAGASEPARR